jgi:shikimate 5-dehydrogenase
MLIGQGAIGFELWTGAPAPVEVMREAALKALGRA